ncbi:Dephospho-CoA kinase [hydrothermal vent metagenome]|uniref:Dephospho-CoA kinase n=1 Tax=hydrothermal vent metagenome TaxID=652676 RepID=A0A3B0U8S1_9ZZZZ
MFKLGLTGSIASGKSTVLKFFADLGYPVFSADQAVHDLYQDRAVGPLAALFPQAIVNGHVDRNVLSSTLAKNPERIKQLEAIVHPLVHEEISNFLRQAQASGARLAVIDIPLLFETGFDHGFDAVALTFCNEELLRARALDRPGMDEKKLDFILDHQLPQHEKKARADYLIDTGNSLEQTKARVVRIVNEILSDK